ncbi:MAG: TetR/AcrR family transcriptional regulator [Acidimicrobiia bacterium]
MALLEAARGCIGRKGLAATTSRDIAHEAGANLAAITYHFGSKDELIARSLLEGFRSWLAPTVDVLTGEGDPATRTLTAIQRLLTTFDEHRDAAAAYLQALAHAPVADPLRQGIIELWGELRVLLAADMRAMQESGELGMWVDPEVMSAVLVAVANGFVVQATVEPDGPSLHALATQFASLLLAVRQPR